MLTTRPPKLNLKHATLEEYEFVIGEHIFSLHEIEISSHQTFSNNLRVALNTINSSDDLSSRYFALEGLAVATLRVTGVVAYARWQVQRETDDVLGFIHQCERHIVELNN